MEILYSELVVEIHHKYQKSYVSYVCKYVEVSYPATISNKHYNWLYTHGTDDSIIQSEDERDWFE